MNGKVRANIPIRRMPEIQRAPLLFQRMRKIDETLAKETNTTQTK
jgi:hypothetical protein